MLWVSFRQPLAWDGIALALAGSALHALPGEQFGLPGHYPQHLALIWLGGRPDELQLAYSIVVHGKGELALMSDEHAALVMILLRILAFLDRPAVAAPGRAGR